jgi:heme A synthase
MRSTYRVLAYVIAALVAFQSAVMVFGVAGLYGYIQDGNTLTKSAMESEEGLGFTGEIGFMLHGIAGMTLIPLLALVLLIVSFFAKIPGGAKWAGAVLGLVVLQVALGIFGHETPYSGMLHGVNALVLFTVALMAGRRTSVTADRGTTAPEVAGVR